jgi:hypothetical protein
MSGPMPPLPPMPPGQLLPPRPGNDVVTADATGGIIPYKNVAALIAYYCGVFSVIPCFPIGVAGVVLGIRGLSFARQHPAARGQVHAWIGIVAGGLLGTLWLLVTLVMVAAGIAAK